MHHHTASNTSSDLDFRVALSDESNSAYTGMIRIEDHTKSCEAFQENRNLLLSDKAKAESIPELEIINNEVSCSHGVTVASLDPDLLFYMNARGISSEDAMPMIIKGYFRETLDKIPTQMRDMMTELLMKKMGVVSDD